MNLRPIPSWTDIPCPHRGCRAQPGEQCRYPAGQFAEIEHPARERAHTNAWLATQGYEPLHARKGRSA